MGIFVFLHAYSEGIIKVNYAEPTENEDNEDPSNVEDDEEDEAENGEEELDQYEALDLVLASLWSYFTFCWIFCHVIMFS